MIERINLPRRRSSLRSAPTFILKWLKPACIASFVNRAIFSSEYPGETKREKKRKEGTIRMKLWRQIWRAGPCRGGVIPSRKTYPASLQTSRRQGICLVNEEGWQTGSIAVSSHPCERTMASRSFFVASLALRIASASSGVIASVIYLNVADLTSSS